MKKLLLTLTAALVMTTTFADAPGYMLVSSAQQQKCVPVTDVAKVTFDDQNMAVNLTDEKTFLFPNSEGWAISFVNTSAVEVVASDADSRVAVYNLQGVKIAESKSLSDIDLQSLPKGVYVITNSGKAHKIIR